MKKLSEYYFALRDYVYADGNTGYTRIELHQLAKKYILPLLLDEDDNFNLDTYSIQDILKATSISTRWLSEKGWNSFIEQFKIFAQENFNVGL